MFTNCFKNKHSFVRIYIFTAKFCPDVLKYLKYIRAFYNDFVLKGMHDYQPLNVRVTYMVVSILTAPPQQGSCRYHPVATIIPHGCCSQDYHGDNLEVRGSVPGAGPPTRQAGATVTSLESIVYLMLWISGKMDQEAYKVEKQLSPINPPAPSF